MTRYLSVTGHSTLPLAPLRAKLHGAVLILILMAYSSNTACACPDIDGLVDVNCDGKMLVMAFGDSITKGVGDQLRQGGFPGRLRKLMPNSIVRNYGDPGEQTWVGKLRAPSKLKASRSPDYVLVLEGVNDYWQRGRSASRTRSNLESIVSTGRRTGAITLLSRLTSVRRSFQIGWVREVNKSIRRITQVDYFSLGNGIISGDLLHPNAAGYDRMAERAYESLARQSELNRPRDSDFDGVYDYEERELGTDPTSTDTDRDGLTDSEELYTYHTNPNSNDSDGDGIRDVTEIFVTHTDPTAPPTAAPRLISVEAVSGPR